MPTEGLRNIYIHLLEEAVQLPDPHSLPANLEALILGSNPTYMRSGGRYGLHEFRNTCVLDSILAGIHFLCTDPKKEELLSMNQTLHAVIRFLKCGEYSKAKALWLINLCLWWNDSRQFQSEFVDIRGYVRDHLPNFRDLECANVYYDEDAARADHFFSLPLNTIRRAFIDHGDDVMLLGLFQDVQLVLLHNEDPNRNLPPLSITDDCDRTFMLQFMLLGAFNHMVLCTKLRDQWIVFDAAATPAFQAIDVSSVGWAFYLAAYVRKDEPE